MKYVFGMILAYLAFIIIFGEPIKEQETIFLNIYEQKDLHSYGKTLSPEEACLAYRDYNNELSHFINFDKEKDWKIEENHLICNFQFEDMPIERINLTEIGYVIFDKR